MILYFIIGFFLLFLTSLLLLPVNKNYFTVEDVLLGIFITFLMVVFWPIVIFLLFLAVLLESSPKDRILFRLKKPKFKEGQFLYSQRLSKIIKINAVHEYVTCEYSYTGLINGKPMYNLSEDYLLEYGFTVISGSMVEGLYGD